MDVESSELVPTTLQTFREDHEFYTNDSKWGELMPSA